MKPTDMVDYYAVLARKIRETSDDPAKVREVVYEAARLALRWQVQGQWPQLSTVQAKGEVSELEAAIARLEAEAAGSGGVDTGEQGKAAPDAVEEFQPQPSDPASKLETEERWRETWVGPVIVNRAKLRRA